MSISGPEPKGLAKQRRVAKAVGQRLPPVAAHETERDAAAGQLGRELADRPAGEVGIEQRAVGRRRRQQPARRLQIGRRADDLAPRGHEPVLDVQRDQRLVLDDEHLPPGHAVFRGRRPARQCRPGRLGTGPKARRRAAAAGCRRRARRGDSGSGFRRRSPAARARSGACRTLAPPAGRTRQRRSPPTRCGDRAASPRRRSSRPTAVRPAATAPRSGGHCSRARAAPAPSAPPCASRAQPADPTSAGAHPRCRRRPARGRDRRAPPAACRPARAGRAARASAWTRPVKLSAKASGLGLPRSDCPAIAWSVASVFLTRWLSSSTSTRCSSSLRLRSLTSRATLEAPTTSPAPLRIGDTVSEINSRRPSFATRTVSK